MEWKHTTITVNMILLPCTCRLTMRPLTVNPAITEKIPADTAGHLSTLDVRLVAAAAPLLKLGVEITTQEIEALNHFYFI